MLGSWRFLVIFKVWKIVLVILQILGGKITGPVVSVFELILIVRLLLLESWIIPLKFGLCWILQVTWKQNRGQREPARSVSLPGTEGGSCLISGC